MRASRGPTAAMSRGRTVEESGCCRKWSVEAARLRSRSMLKQEADYPNVRVGFVGSSTGQRRRRAAQTEDPCGCGFATVSGTVGRRCDQRRHTRSEGSRVEHDKIIVTTAYSVELRGSRGCGQGTYDKRR